MATEKITVNTKDENGKELKASAMIDLDGYIATLSAEDKADWLREIIRIRIQDAGRRALKSGEDAAQAMSDWVRGVKKARGTRTIVKIKVITRKSLLGMGLSEAEVDEVLEFVDEHSDEPDAFKKLEEMVSEFLEAK